MKVRTIQRFREKDNFSIVHEIGSEFECSNERGTYLADLGFVELVLKAEPAAVEPEKEAEPEKPAKPNTGNKPLSNKK